MTDDPTRLVREYRSGATGAADDLAALALRIALRTATAVLADRQAASDVAQDVALEVLRGVDRLRDPDKLKPWIHRVAIREAVRAAKRTRKRWGREAPFETMTPGQEPTTPDGPEDAAERGELAGALGAALTALPDKQRTALLLRYVHDLSYEDVAEAMEVPVGTVGALISRGQAALRGAPGLAAFAPQKEEERS